MVLGLGREAHVFFLVVGDRRIEVSAVSRVDLGGVLRTSFLSRILGFRTERSLAFGLLHSMGWGHILLTQ